MRIKKSLKQRLLEKLPEERRPDKCWEFQGSTDRHGYGVIRIRPKRISAHRAAWKVFNGKAIPDGMQVNHHCDNSKCCNPDHLYVGTHKDNMRDMTERGRAFVVAPDEVLREAVSLCKSGLPQAKVSRLLNQRGFKLSQMTISQWVRGKVRRIAFRRPEQLTLNLPQSDSNPRSGGL